MAKSYREEAKDRPMKVTSEGDLVIPSCWIDAMIEEAGNSPGWACWITILPEDGSAVVEVKSRDVAMKSFELVLREKKGEENE